MDAKSPHSPVYTTYAQTDLPGCIKSQNMTEMLDIIHRTGMYQLHYIHQTSVNQ